MKKIEYIIVGQGLAGTCLAFHLRLKNKSVLIVDKQRKKTSSKVALGVYNPMILKRFTLSWKVEEQLSPLNKFLDEFELFFDKKIHKPMKILRRFDSVFEQNLWSERSQINNLSSFMNSNLLVNDNPNIFSDYGFGEVNFGGKVDILKMIALYKNLMIHENLYLEEEFDFSSLEIKNNLVYYKYYQASKIIFCEGTRLINNPFFSWLPLNPTKGELITVKLKKLQVKELLKSRINLLPIGKDIYKVGATFNWDQKDELCTEIGREDLIKQLKKLVKIEPDIIKHEAGLRPTVKDRRALLGVSPNYSNVYIFNGLGTRGLLLAPYLSLQLIEFIEKGVCLDPEVDIKRFEN